MFEKKPAAKKPAVKKKAAAPAKYELLQEGDLWYIVKGSLKLGPFPKECLEAQVQKNKNLGRI